MGYDFPTVEYRARCLRVIDGDTVELVVDPGLARALPDRCGGAKEDA